MQMAVAKPAGEEKKSGGVPAPAKDKFFIPPFAGGRGGGIGSSGRGRGRGNNVPPPSVKQVKNTRSASKASLMANILLGKGPDQPSRDPSKGDASDNGASEIDEVHNLPPKA